MFTVKQGWFVLHWHLTSMVCVGPTCNHGYMSTRNHGYYHVIDHICHLPLITHTPHRSTSKMTKHIEWLRNTTNKHDAANITQFTCQAVLLWITQSITCCNRDHSNSAFHSIYILHIPIPQDSECRVYKHILFYKRIICNITLILYRDKTKYCHNGVQLWNITKYCFMVATYTILHSVFIQNFIQNFHLMYTVYFWVRHLPLSF